MLSPIHTLLINMQHALLGAVAPSLRAVTVDVDMNHKRSFFFFFYDQIVSKELFELASVAVTEAFLPDFFVEQKIVELDAPNPIPLRGKLAFLRKEPCLPNFRKEDRIALLKTVNPLSVLFLDTQEALLGKVSSALRLVTADVNTDNKQLDFYFAYDGPISEEDQNLATAAIQEASVSFPGYEIHSQIKRVDGPKGLSAHSKRAAYLRWEPS